MASRGINKAIIIGNLGSDPEIRYTAAGAAVANVSVATTISRKRETGEQVEYTEWHRIVFFGRLAEIAGEYLRKGSKIYIEGRLQTRKWQDKEGNERYMTEIVANEMQMLDSRGGGPASADQATPPSPPTNTTPTPPSPPTNTTPTPPSPPTPATKESGPKDTDDFDDDIPF